MWLNCEESIAIVSLGMGSKEIGSIVLLPFFVAQKNERTFDIIITMNHVVYLDAKSNELENLLQGKKTMIIRGAMGKKLPYGRVKKGEKLYFVRNNGEGLIKATGIVNNVSESEKLSKEESKKLVNKYRYKLLITDKMYNRFAGKRNIILIQVENIKEIQYFILNKEKFGNMDDWIIFEKIEEIK